MLTELRRIRAFLAVARLQNFTRAAIELNVSQSALSVQIRQLEEQLGTVLFDRNRRRVSVTPAAQDLLPRLERIVHDIESVVADAHDASGVVRGTVTVATLPSLAGGLLPRAVATLTRQLPGITVRIVDAVAARVVDLAKCGEVDFAVGSMTRGDRDVICRLLRVDRFCAFVSPRHPLAKRKVLSLRELAGQPLILPARDSSVRARFEVAAHREGIAIKPAYEAVYNSTVLGLAREGLGVAVLTEMIAAYEADAAALCTVAIRSPVIQREIVQIVPKGRPLSAAAERFSKVLREAARDDQEAQGAIADRDSCHAHSLA